MYLLLCAAAKLRTALLDIRPDAIVAGDPHRQLEMPNMYAEAHVACEDFDVIGLTVPGVPGFSHLGHTENVAGRCRPPC